MKNTFNDIIEETINEGDNENSTKYMDNNSKLELIKNKFDESKHLRNLDKKANTSLKRTNTKVKTNQLLFSSPNKRKSSNIDEKGEIKSPMNKFRKEKANPKFDKNYWNKNAQVRFPKRQKTVKLNIMKITEGKLSVIKNYAYSINDFFSNGNFNMDRLKPLNLDEIKRNLKQNNIVYKQLSEQEKKAYITERKKLREKQLSLKIKKIDELRDEGKPFLIIKIKNDSIGQYNLNSILFYSEKEIFMAKKCILNNWKYPPPEFFDDYFRRTDKLLKEEEDYNNELI